MLDELYSGSIVSQPAIIILGNFILITFHIGDHNELKNVDGVIR